MHCTGLESDIFELWSISHYSVMCIESKHYNSLANLKLKLISLGIHTLNTQLLLHDLCTSLCSIKFEGCRYKIRINSNDCLTVPEWCLHTLLRIAEERSNNDDTNLHLDLLHSQRVQLEFAIFMNLWLWRYSKVQVGLHHWSYASFGMFVNDTMHAVWGFEWWIPNPCKYRWGTW